MTNVLIVTDNLILPSGITMVIKNLIQNSDLSKVKYSIITLDNRRNNTIEYFKSIGVDVFIMPGPQSPVRIRPFADFVRNFKFIELLWIGRFFDNFFNTHHFDVVHSHFAQFNNIIFSIARKHGVKCCISHSHSSKLSESKLRALRNEIFCKDLLAKSDICAACSEMAGVSLYGSEFTTSSKKMIIKNGVQVTRFVYDLHKREAIRAQYGLSDEMHLLGTVGRLNSVKNQSFLIDILHALNENYYLMLVGDGECREALYEKTKKYGLVNRVLFVGAQSDIQSYLSAFDLFLMPSHHEGLGISAIEAQANGLECIVSTGIPREVNLTNVQYLSVDDLNIWVKCIEEAPKKHHEDYLEAVIEGGYDIKDVGRKLVSFYNSIEP